MPDDIHENIQTSGLQRHRCMSGSTNTPRRPDRRGGVHPRPDELGRLRAGMSLTGPCETWNPAPTLIVPESVLGQPRRALNHPWPAGLLLLALLAAGCGQNQSWPAEREPYQPAGLEPLACVPDLDGRITAAELNPTFDLPVRYLVSPAGEQRAVDVAGRVGADGGRIWDWGADYASDQVAQVSAGALDGQWYAEHFPAGMLVLPVDLGGAIEAVYAYDDQSFRLLGLASAESDPPAGRTLLVYQQPVELYRFPLQPGMSWVGVGEVRDGILQDLPYAGRDVYQVEVAGGGELVLPDLTFTQVLQVHTRTVIEPAAGQTTSTRQVGFLFECYGEVARATSLPGEPERDFTTAAQVRRLGL